ncbi:MAG: LysR family transcriptional regulator [Desulfovibrionaceae bacterium]
METRVLRYFVEAIRHRSITRAAEYLHVTQPTLSRQLKELEQELGQTLFKRVKYSIMPTAEGTVLYARALDILAMVDRTEEEFRMMADFNGGEVAIGCAESQGMRIVARAVKRLQDRYPLFRIHLFSGNAETVLERMDKGLLDFAVVLRGANPSRFHACELPHREEWGLLLRKDSPLSSMREIPVEMLADLPLIISAYVTSGEMPEWLTTHLSHLNVRATYNLAFNAAILVQEGVGHALVIAGIVPTSAESVLCFRPIRPRIESTMRIIWNRSTILSRAAQVFLDEVRLESPHAPAVTSA